MVNKPHGNSGAKNCFPKEENICSLMYFPQEKMNKRLIYKNLINRPIFNFI